jgi:uncharacterized protein (DUF488 family)
MGEAAEPGLVLYTVGHSTRSAAEFVAILAAHQVRQLADVRTVPRSRRHPQFEREALAAHLAAHGIGYRHVPRLGGLRRPRRDSTNTAWRTPGFRGYADYMQTPDFEAGVAELLAYAATGQTVVMCAEALWWRCHRALLADALVARGVAVWHILSPTERQPHRLTPFARVESGRVSYPGLVGGNSEASEPERG